MKVILENGIEIDTVTDFYNLPEIKSVSIPECLSGSSMLKPNLFRTYCFLVSCTDMDTLKVDVTREKISHYLNVSIFTAGEHLRSLSSLGLISTKRRGLTLTNYYYMCKVPQKFIDAYYETKARVEALREKKSNE